MLCCHRWAKEMKTKNELLEVIAELQNEVIAWKVHFANACNDSFDAADELYKLKKAYKELLEQKP